MKHSLASGKARAALALFFALRQFCETAIAHDKDLNIVFVDQEKAFDRVNRCQLWKVLEEYGVAGQLLENIMALNKSSLCAFRSTEGLSDWFPIRSGVRQGCVLSPLLFITYINKNTKAANDNIPKLNELLFADD